MPMHAAFKTFLFLGITFLLSAPGFAQNDDVVRALTAQGHALLIGVSRYNDQRWPPLTSVNSEISQLQSGLAGHFARITPLINPSVEEIRAALRDLFSDIGRDPKQRLFVFYAGHGFTDTNPTSGEEYGYITGSDTPEYNADPRGAVINGISMGEIDQIARRAAARQALIVFDSCFSGSIFMTRSPAVVGSLSQQNVADLLRRPVRSYITAGRANQRIPADSPMATLLLRGIAGAADKYGNGFVTDADLGVYLQNTFPAATGNMAYPQFGRSPTAAFSDGAFIFLERPSVQEVVARPPARPPQGSRPVFLAFYDWKSENLTPEALQIVVQAAAAWKARGGLIQVTGYTDTSLSAAESQELSERMAHGVANTLVRLGVPRENLLVSGRGQNDLRVPTRVGVREPQNRRVEIVFQ